MNPFTGISMFLICVLETFKCFYKQIDHEKKNHKFPDKSIFHNVIPNVLRFHVTNKTLKDSLTYSRCQQLLLNEEIRCKKRRLRQLMFEYDRIKQELQYQLSPIDFMHVSLFLVSNDKAIRKNDKRHGRKLQKLISNIHEKVLLIMFHMILTK